MGKRLEKPLRENGPLMQRVAPRLWRNRINNRYYAIYRAGGRTVWKSLKTTIRAVADQLLRDELAGRARVKAGGGKLLFSDVAKEYFATVIAARRLKPSTLEDLGYNRDAIYRTWPALQTMQLAAIDEAACQRWFGSLSGSWQRLNHQLCLLKAILEWAAESGHITRNPAKRIRPIKGQKTTVQPPSAENVKRLIEHLRHGGKRTQNAADFVELLASTGMRLGEAAGLCWEDVDFERGVVLVRRQMNRRGDVGTLKGRHEHPLPMFAMLRDVLERIAKRTGRQGRVLKVRQVRGPIATACEALSIPYMTHHAFRHAFATLAIERMVDFKTISVWLGHSDGGKLVSDTYGHLREGHAAEMAERMK